MSLENSAATADTTAAPQAPASELQPQANPPVADGGEGQVGEVATQENQPQGEYETPEQASRKRERREARFSELSKRARDAEADAAYWRGRAEANTHQRPQEQPAPQAAVKPAGPPDPKSYPQGEFDPRYAADLAKHELREELRAEEEKKTATQRKADQEAALAAGYQRYEQTLQYAREVADSEQGEFYQNAPRFLEYAARNLATDAVDLITDSEYAVQVAEYLGRDAQRVADYRAMSPVQRARFVGNLEAQIRLRSAPAQQPQAQPAAAKPAPTPQPPAFPTAPAAGAAVPFDPNKGSMEDFVRWRNGG